MSNEIRYNSSLQIQNPAGNLVYLPRDTQFQANMVGTRGPTPGCILATTVGTDIDLSELGLLGGMCRLKNKDLVNFVTWGIRIGSNFIPIGEILPGEFYVIRLSRYLGDEFGAGTSIITGGGKLHLLANEATVEVLVEAFDA